MFSEFITVVACVGISFLFRAEQYSIVWMDIFFIHSSVDGHWVASASLKMVSINSGKLLEIFNANFFCFFSSFLFWTSY